LNLEIVKTEQNTELKVTERYSNEHATLLKQFIAKQQAFARISKDLTTMEQDLEEYKSIIILSKVTLSGRDWFKLLNEKAILVSPHTLYTAPSNKWRTHNCAFSLYDQKEKIVKVLVKPEFFLFTKQWKQSMSWYFDG